MQIIAVKASLNPNRVYVHLSDGLVLPMFLDDVVALKLKSGQEFDSDTKNNLISTSVFYLLREFAYRQIAISPKTETDIRLKLHRKLKMICLKMKIGSVSEDLVKKCIDDLNSKNLLNPKDFVRYFVNKNRNKSRQEISYLLRKHGIDKQAIEDNFTAGESETDKIKKLLSKKVKDVSQLSDYKTRAKVMSYLVRKGFSYEEVKNVIDDVRILK